MPDTRQSASDEDLAIALQGGDEAAFDELMRRHQGRVFAVAYRITCNREDALDVAQEVFVKAFRRIRAWRPSGSFGAWLVRLTVNQAIDHLRRMKRRGAGRVAHVPEGARELEPEAPAIEQTDRKAGAAEIEARVQAALAVLSPMQRTVFVLRHYEGMALAEIAPAAGCSVGSVKVHLFRALRKLRNELKDLER